MSRDVVQKTKTPSKIRPKMLAKIHVEFAQMRRDLRHSPQELRLERLSFCERVLNLRKPLDSMRRLTDAQLARVIEAIKTERPQGTLPGCAAHHFRENHSVSSGPEQMGQVHHLAGQEQVWAINRLMQHLGWSQASRQDFLLKRFKRSSPNLLTPKQANSLMMILLTIAARKHLKEQRGGGDDVVISRKDIWRYIPTLKRKLGIDQGGKQ